jgi:multiple sugar transport system ATP-binding protein
MNLVEGKLIIDNDDIVFIPSGSNNNIKIPVGNYSFKNKFDGTEISAYLGIRPEHIYFEKINPDCFEINLKSELLEYTGHEQIVTFDYFGQQVLGKFASTFDIEINKNLKLNIDTSQISLFDKDSQKRI